LLKNSACRRCRAFSAPWQHRLEHHLPRLVARADVAAVRADELIDDVQAQPQAIAGWKLALNGSNSRGSSASSIRPALLTRSSTLRGSRPSTSTLASLPWVSALPTRFAATWPSRSRSPCRRVSPCMSR
jgi:hypothetical protein